MGALGPASDPWLCSEVLILFCSVFTGLSRHKGKCFLTCFEGLVPKCFQQASSEAWVRRRGGNKGPRASAAAAAACICAWKSEASKDLLSGHTAQSFFLASSLQRLGLRLP